MEIPPRYPGGLMVSPLISDGAVLQRDVPLKISGGGGIPGGRVEAEFAGVRCGSHVEKTGCWEVEIPPMAAGGPYVLTVTSGSGRLIVRNILVGEVWLCCGQSNMQFTLGDWMRRHSPAVPEAGPGIRYFAVGDAVSGVPSELLSGSWKECRGADLAGCSAAAFFFARGIQEQLKVPVGLVVSALWDSEISAWSPGPDRPEVPHGPSEAARPLIYQDPGISDLSPAQPDFDDSLWGRITIPGYWQLQGHRHSGSVWLRKEVDLPVALAERALVLEPGIPDDYDTALFNGIEIGRTGPETPDSYVVPRRYRIPPELVRPGRNLVALRIFDACSLGGVAGKAADVRISADGDSTISIPVSGEWRVHCEHVYRWLWSQSPGPGLLFNAMIHPLRKFSIRGAIWYQGESDRIRAHRYADMLSSMVQAWREAWASDFPFLIVQLAGFFHHPAEPGESLWAEIREAQRIAAGKIPLCGMVVAADVGEHLDIHPKDKATVGGRLAALALEKTYGQCVASSGPVYERFTVEGDRIRLHFSEADGLRFRGAPVGFAIAGSDGVFRWGDAGIEGATVVVRHPDLPDPVAVRYGWSDFPPCVLENGAGLPASPFRTDDFPLLSQATLH